MPETATAPSITFVDFAETGYLARCREHGGIAVKDSAEDAEMACALHLARVHANETWPKPEARRA